MINKFISFNSTTGERFGVIIDDDVMTPEDGLVITKYLVMSDVGKVNLISPTEINCFKDQDSPEMSTLKDFLNSIGAF